jgi:gliding motility-associated-like protein
VFIHVGSTGTGIAAIADYDTTLVNQPVAIKVTTNDINPSGDPLLVSLCGYPLHGIVEVNTDNSITYTPHNGYQGDDVFCYRICNVLNPGMCSDTMVYVHVKQPSLDDIFVYTGISPNHDDNNDTWVVKGIELYPDNTVQIYNRWGDIIKEFAGYNNLTKVWDGTNESGEIVPDGTYFYIINLKFVGVLKGWIYKQGN